MKKKCGNVFNSVHTPCSPVSFSPLISCAVKRKKTLNCRQELTTKKWLQNCNERELYTEHCSKGISKFRDITWYVEENELLHEIFRVVLSLVFPAIFHVISRKITLGQCTEGEDGNCKAASFNYFIT